MCTNVHSFEYLLKFYIIDRRLAESTVKHYNLVIRLFQKETGISDIRELDKFTIVEWRNAVHDRTSAATCNNYLRHLKSLFSWAYDEDLIEKESF